MCNYEKKVCELLVYENVCLCAVSADVPAYSLQTGIPRLPRLMLFLIYTHHILTYCAAHLFRRQLCCSEDPFWNHQKIF